MLNALLIACDHAIGTGVIHGSLQSDYEVAEEHDWRLVALAAGVCFLTSFAAIHLFQRALATTGRTRPYSDDGVQDFDEVALRSR